MLKLLTNVNVSLDNRSLEDLDLAIFILYSFDLDLCLLEDHEINQIKLKYSFSIILREPRHAMDYYQSKIQVTPTL